MQLYCERVLPLSQTYTMPSPNPDDEDYDSLVQAHIVRLAKIMGRG